LTQITAASDSLNYAVYIVPGQIRGARDLEEIVMSRTFTRKAPLALVAVLALAALAGCTQPLAKCEGGVSDLSTLSSVTAQNPC
jgi:hypothetical protein